MQKLEEQEHEAIDGEDVADEGEARTCLRDSSNFF